MMAASARGEGASYERKRKQAMKKAEEHDRKILAGEKWRCTVNIKSATVLLSTDANGLSDPYVEVYIGDETSWKKLGSTKVKPETLSPVWDETFSGIVDGLHTEVKLKLFDKDKFGSDYVGTYKSGSHATGGTKLDMHPKGNYKLITAQIDATFTWVKGYVNEKKNFDDITN